MFEWNFMVWCLCVEEHELLGQWGYPRGDSRRALCMSLGLCVLQPLDNSLVLNLLI